MADDQNSPKQGTLLVHWRQLAASWPDLLRILATGTFRLSADYPSFVQLPEAAGSSHQAPATDLPANTAPPSSTTTPDSTEPEALRPLAPPLRRIPQPRRLAAPAGLQRRRSAR